jgi:hypothetical protein
VIQSDLQHWARKRGHGLPLGFEVKPVFRSRLTGAAQIVRCTGLESTNLPQGLGSGRPRAVVGPRHDGQFWMQSRRIASTSNCISSWDHSVWTE